MPTLDLLTQTARAWRAAGRAGTAIAVCSAEEALRHDRDAGHDAQITTSPLQLAAYVGAEQRVSVYATYASLPVLIAAHRDHALPRWDVLIIDEAHRTAGRLGKAWAAVHHDAQIPARRRLYQTATPRIWASDALDAQPVATMDDTDLFGSVAYRLGHGEAIRRGLLADYQILVPVVADHDVHRLLTDTAELDGEATRTIALQVALLRAIREAGLDGSSLTTGASKQPVPWPIRCPPPRKRLGYSRTAPSGRGGSPARSPTPPAPASQKNSPATRECRSSPTPACSAKVSTCQTSMQWCSPTRKAPPSTPSRPSAGPYAKPRRRQTRHDRRPRLHRLRTRSRARHRVLGLRTPVADPARTACA